MSHCFLIRTTCRFWTRGAENTCDKRGMCTWALGCVAEKESVEVQLMHVKWKCIVLSHIQPVVVHPNYTIVQHLSKSHLGFDRIDLQIFKKERQISTVVCWFDTQAGSLTFSSQQQKDSRGIQTEAEILYATLVCCSTVPPLYSCFYLSLNLSVSLSYTHTALDILFYLFGIAPIPILSDCLFYFNQAMLCPSQPALALCETCWRNASLDDVTWLSGSVFFFSSEFLPHLITG